MKALINYFHPLEAFKRKQKKYLSTTKLPEILFNMVNTPVTKVDDIAKDSEFIVLDLETTGLNSEKDLILSIGWVCISNNTIDLASANHLYLNNDSQIKAETAVINHITPQMLSEGVPLRKAMELFFEAAKGKILVAHACIVEANFINQYLLDHYQLQEVPLFWLDTLCIEKKMEKAVSNHQQVSLTLADTRERYGLPQYNNHNALADAVSTAELLLAQQKRLDPKSDATVGCLFRRSQ